MKRLLDLLKRFLNWLLDLIFPPRCTFCGELLDDGEEGLCGLCQEELPWTTEDEPEKVCAPATRCVTPVWYRDVSRVSLIHYKFRGEKNLSGMFGRLMAQCVQERLGLDFDLICWAPLSAERLEERGYDQSELLARELSSRLDRPAVPALCKTRHTVKQSSLTDDAARAQNAAGVYKCVDPAAVQGKRVLLVDDIVTTGSTLSNCAQTLLDAGAKEVWAAAFARARM